MLTAEQRKERSEAIYGSDMPGIIMDGSDRALIIAEKAGIIQPRDFSGDLAIEAGNRLERVMIEWAAEFWNEDVIESNETYECDHFNALKGHPDGLFCQSRAGLEIKVVGAGMAGSWGTSGTNRVPMSVYIQCQSYMAIVGLDKWRVFALINSTDPRWFELEKDDDSQAIILDEAQEAWKEVLLAKKGLLDPMQCVDFNSTRAQKQIHQAYGKLSENSQEIAYLDPEFIALNERRKEVTKLKTDADKELRAIKAKFELAMKGAKNGVCGNVFEVIKSMVSVKPSNGYEYTKTTFKDIKT